jgi:hypothetical protein
MSFIFDTVDLLFSRRESRLRLVVLLWLSFSAAGFIVVRADGGDDFLDLAKRRLHFYDRDYDRNLLRKTFWDRFFDISDEGSKVGLLRDVMDFEERNRVAVKLLRKAKLDLRRMNELVRYAKISYRFFSGSDFGGDLLGEASDLSSLDDVVVHLKDMIAGWKAELAGGLLDGGNRRRISVRRPSASKVLVTAPSISSSKLGHPQCDSNLSEDL